MNDVANFVAGEIIDSQECKIQVNVTELIGAGDNATAIAQDLVRKTIEKYKDFAWITATRDISERLNANLLSESSQRNETMYFVG